MHLAIILRKEDRGEADELVVFMSRDLGWLRGVAKNSRRSRVRFGGHLETFSAVELSLRPRRRDDLVWIEDSQVVEGFLGIRKEIGKVAAASYFLELASLFMGEGSPEPPLFDFLHHFLRELDATEPQPLVLLFDEIRLLGMLGLQPSFGHCAACGGNFEAGSQAAFVPAHGGACHMHCVGPGMGSTPLSPQTVAIVQRGLQLDAPAASRLRLSRKGLDELRRALSAFVRFMRGREVKSLAFIESLARWSHKKRLSEG
ncbi:MAG: DNA repair protein RecO [Thermodesulfobacteriota bacterium]